MTQPQRRMLEMIIQHKTVERGTLFRNCGAHSSGYRVLAVLMELGYVTTSITGSYMNGTNPVTWCKITDAGRAAINS